MLSRQPPVYQKLSRRTTEKLGLKTGQFITEDRNLSASLRRSARYGGQAGRKGAEKYFYPRIFTNLPRDERGAGTNGPSARVRQLTDTMPGKSGIEKRKGSAFA